MGDFMRLRNVKNKEEIMKNSKYLINDYFNYCGRWKELFGNTNPIYIEIGMGKGKFIIENARMYPNINFIGIEKYDSVVAKGLQKIPDDLDNLLIIRADALDLDKIFSKEISRIYLNFSDPWPKKRHHLRRLSSKIFLEKYEKVFTNSKEIFMRTDNQELYKYSLISFSENGYILDELSFDLHKDDMPKVTTEYEDKFTDKGLPIYYVKCRKNV